MKKILIIGAGYLQHFLIKKAKEMGYYTLSVDADPNAIGFRFSDKYAVINIVDEDACLKFAMEEHIDGVLTAATDYGVLTASYIADKMGLPGLNYESAKLIKNKYLVRKCLFENKVDDTEQAYEVDSTTDIKKISKQLIYPVMVKPCDGSGSRGASRVDKAENLENACKYAMAGSITHRAEIESFILGLEYGAESLVVNGEVHVLGIMKKWMTEPPYYAELGHAIPCGLSDDLVNKIKDCVSNAIKALNVNHGSVNMDMLITNEGKVHIIDIGARMGGNMIGPCIIPYATGIDYMGLMLKAAVGEKVTFDGMSGLPTVSRLLAFPQGIVKTLPDFNKIEKDYGVEIYHHIKLGDEINEYQTNLDGCGYIIVKDKDFNKAITIADEVLTIIRETIFEEQK